MRSFLNSRCSDFRDSEATARRWSPAGYTLIELLIASVLSATLMTITWGLLSMYSGWLTAGRVQSEERQLKRSLLVQLQDDLESVAFVDGGRQVQFLESLADETEATAESLVPEDLEDPLVSAMEPSLEAEDVPSWLQSLQLPKDLRGVPGISLAGTATMLRLIIPRQMSADELSAPNTAPVVNAGDGTTETPVATNPAEVNTDMQAVQGAATVPVDLSANVEVLRVALLRRERVDRARGHAQRRRAAPALQEGRLHHGDQGGRAGGARRHSQRTPRAAQGVVEDSTDRGHRHHRRTGANRRFLVR